MSVYVASLNTNVCVCVVYLCVHVHIFHTNTSIGFYLLKQILCYLNIIVAEGPQTHLFTFVCRYIKTPASFSFFAFFQT